MSSQSYYRWCTTWVAKLGNILVAVAAVNSRCAPRSSLWRRKKGEPAPAGVDPDPKIVPGLLCTAARGYHRDAGSTTFPVTYRRNLDAPGSLVGVHYPIKWLWSSLVISSCGENSSSEPINRWKYGPTQSWVLDEPPLSIIKFLINHHLSIKFISAINKHWITAINQ